MKEIIRNKYLLELNKYKDKPFIKILIGIRKCGKSTILMQFINTIKKNDNIIFLDFNDYSTVQLIKSKDDLHNFINSKYKKNTQNYIIIDEIQEIKDFQQVLNSWINIINVDIYITGSNSKLLSSEISTLITAKNIKINVFPLSFAEFYEYSTNELKLNKTDSFNNYFKYGGMPGRLYWDEEIQIWKYLNMIYTDILQHDILNREKINNIKEFSNIYYFLQDNLGKETSIKNIANYLVTNNSSNITAPIVSKYLNLLISCFLLQEISEYDISGKKILVNKNKYYPMDIGLRNSITKNFINNRGKILESIILNELLINNYDVKIGKGRNINEIDFIAVKNSNKIYIQICEYLTEEIRNREINNLLSINDNFPKLILSLDSFNSKDEKGIEYMNIIDWLLLNK